VQGALNVQPDVILPKPAQPCRNAAMKWAVIGA
jgi:hypothetical protein